jgi:hypothetical protein
MAGFIDTMRAEGHAVESICRVLREQGCQIAARTYRGWRSAAPAARTISDARVVDAVRSAAWTTDIHGRRKMTPEGLYGRRKMTALLRRTTAPRASAGSVDRAMRTLGLSGVRRNKGIRTTIPSKDGKRAGDLLDRDFTAVAPNHVWVTDFTYCRTWAGWVYVAFIVDVFAQRIVAWHASTSSPRTYTSASSTPSPASSSENSPSIPTATTSPPERPKAPPENEETRTNRGSGSPGCPETSQRRDDRIRTCDLTAPNGARYQAALHPVAPPL